ncbi:MAG: DUF1801 domain-containing protein [Candidatus Limnocylindria bacterium]
MHGQSNAPDPDAYIAELDDARGPQIAAIDAQIRRAAPGLDRRMQSGMIAYGHYSYGYATGRTGEWFLIGLASNKQSISLYVGPLALEPYAERLPKANLGRGCIRVKRAEDLDPTVLAEIVTTAARDDGAHIETDRDGNRIA